MAILKSDVKPKKQRERSGYKLLYRVAACVVCFFIAAGTFVFGFVSEKQPPDIQVWDGFEEINGEVRIDGIDSLNYFSARRVLLGESAGTVSSVKADVVSYTPCVSEKSFPKEDANGEIVYYEFDPLWEYTVTRVVYFKAELIEKDGFLADKLGGIGEIDVIMTENSISDMITFMRGGRYYSCYLNSYFADGKKEKMTYTTHIYIDGFCIVKNTEQDNYDFKILIENGQVVEVDCDYGECLDGEWDLEADRIRIVGGSSVLVKTNVTYGITELERYFNTAATMVVEPENGLKRRGTKKV